MYARACFRAAADKFEAVQLLPERVHPLVRFIGAEQEVAEPVFRGAPVAGMRGMRCAFVAPRGES